MYELKTRPGYFKQKEVDRTARDVVRYVRLIGLGSFYNRMYIDQLIEILMLRDRYRKHTYQEVRNVISQTEGIIHDHYEIHIKDELIWVI